MASDTESLLDGLEDTRSDSSSDSDDESDYSCTEEELFKLDDVKDWTYVAFSNDGEYFKNQKWSYVPRGDFKLVYEAHDRLLLEQVNDASEHALREARKHLYSVDDGQPLEASECFLAALPKEFLTIFAEWLKTGTREIIFDELIDFLKCEIYLRSRSCSATELALDANMKRAYQSSTMRSWYQRI